MTKRATAASCSHTCSRTEAFPAVLRHSADTSTAQWSTCQVEPVGSHLHATLWFDETDVTDHRNINCFRHLACAVRGEELESISHINQWSKLYLQILCRCFLYMSLPLKEFEMPQRLHSPPCYAMGERPCTKLYGLLFTVVWFLFWFLPILVDLNVHRLAKVLLKLGWDSYCCGVTFSVLS